MTSPRYSILPARAVFDGELTLAQKVVLAALGTYTDRDGWCFPSQKELVSKLGISRASVCEAIKKLASLGYIAVRARTSKGRGKVGNEYRVCMDLPTVEKPMSSQPDIGSQVIESAPMSSGLDNGPMSSQPDMPMSSQPDIAYSLTTPSKNDPKSKDSDESLDSLVLTPPDAKPKRKATKARKAYTPEFDAIWRSWPAHRRANSDKRKAFDRFQSGVEIYGAEPIALAAKKYLGRSETRKENYRYCVLVEVFMNGKLEAAVEDALGTLPSSKREVWDSSLKAWVEKEL